VGFYGGVNYGFGYGGSGFDGGRWQGGHFAYNTAVMHVNTSVIHNTYSQRVSYGSNRTSFNGGPGGVSARPSEGEAAMARQHGQSASVPAAQQRATAGGQVPARQATENRGRPTNTAAARPAEANNRSAEPQNRMAKSAAPSSVKPEQHQAVGTRAAPQQTHEAKPEQVRQQAPKQIASNRSNAPSRSAPEQQRSQAAHATAPEHAAAKPAEGKAERK
jgi:hypothetical protein